MRRVAIAAVTLAATAAGFGSAASVASAHPASFTRGFTDSIWQSSSDPNPWFSRTVTAGAKFVLLAAAWPSISPQRPSGDASDPANPAYHWDTLDQAVRDASAHGLKVALSLASAGGPAWADGPGRPAGVPAGTWEPNDGAFAAFAQAVARRYSGTFNPGSGTLPHVSYYQAWGEPNLPDHLNPQWVRSGGHWVAESPLIYRGLLNAFYAAVKSVNGSNVVITAGTAPFGDAPGGQRVPPALFVRSLLCLRGTARKPKKASCSDPPHFDILAHHPYAVGGPYWHAFNADDVSLPDMWKLERPLALAERTGRALPRGRKQVWVTEFSWNSSPPNPQGVPMRRWAHWLEESFYVLWSEGVDAIAWYLLVDEPCVPSCGVTYQSGVYYNDGQPKPGFEAYRFPFVVRPAGRGRVLVWGITPASGTVLVQRRSGGGWRTVKRFGRRANAIFTARISLSGHPAMRARVGSETSIVW